MHLVCGTISGGDPSNDWRDDPRPARARHRQVRSGLPGSQQHRPGRVAINENSKLTGVGVRPDGLVRLERETGWTVIGPSGVVAVTWRNDTERSGPVSLSSLAFARPPQLTAASAIARCRPTSGRWARWPGRR